MCLAFDWRGGLALGRRHDQERSKKFLFIKLKSDFTFKKILGMNLMDHCEFIVEVGDRAGKEYSIEQKLNEMNSRWEEISF